MTAAFSYNEMTNRNIGFITEAEQEALQGSCVFVCGVGGMGGACLQALARAGVGRFIIADMDVYEVSNINRQVFATMETADVLKTEATRAGILNINPEAEIILYDDQWLDQIDDILSQAHVIVNGMDDIAATVLLYRHARKAKLSVIDAYAASLPSVYVTRPDQKTPEERLGYPTLNRAQKEWSDDDISTSFMRELEYVMAVSSSRHYMDLKMGAEMAAGNRKRMSYAPMVITTGNLMAYEALNVLINGQPAADNRGYFFNPYTCKTECPPPALITFFLIRIARRIINKLMAVT